MAVRRPPCRGWAIGLGTLVAIALSSTLADFTACGCRSVATLDFRHSGQAETGKA